MTSICNDTGRALEYAIVNKISSFLMNKDIKFQFSERALSNNQRDKLYFNKLLPILKEDFIKCAKIFTIWAEQSGWFKGATNIEIDRLPDTAGVKGDVTDIRLKIKIKNSTFVKNISVKHHHNALKHPRLPRLPEQCGIKDEKIKRRYIEKHTQIWKTFLEKAHGLNPNIIEFNKLKKLNNSFIDLNLYKPLILLVKDFLEENANNPDNVSTFFKFLTGSFNFYTIKNENNNVIIKHFIDLKSPQKFKIDYPYNSLTTFLMELDNGWKITFRLHTASSKFFKNGKINQSTKFDVICINLNEVIKIEKITKS